MTSGCSDRASTYAGNGGNSSARDFVATNVAGMPAASGDAIATADAGASADRSATPRAIAPSGAADPDAPTGPLKIAPGYYVAVAVPCERASDVFFYDGKRVAVPDLDDAGRLKGLSPQSIGPVAAGAGGSAFIEDLGVEVFRLPKGRIQLTIQDDGPPMRRCARETLPARLRVR